MLLTRGTYNPPQPLWRDTPEMLDTSPLALTGAYAAGVYDGKLWAMNTHQDDFWINFDGTHMDAPSGTADPTLTTKRGWWATPVGLFLLYEHGGETFLARWQTGDGSWTSVKIEDTATLQIAATQINNLAYCGAGRLLWNEYCSGGTETPEVQFSVDSGTNWSDLFECTVGAIKHFHGVQCHTTGWLRVWCTTATTATVTISGTTVVLTTDGTPVTLTYETEYTTINDLVDEINDNQANWSAELVFDRDMNHHGTEDAGTLATTGPGAAGSCLLAINAQVLYDASVPSNLRVEKVLMFTGDADNECSILICEDIPDLLADGAAWKINWELDVATRPGTSDYVYGVGEATHRVVTMALSQDGRYGYWYPDSATAGTDGIFRFDFLSGTSVKLLDVDGGIGWETNTTPDGICLIGVGSNTDAAAYSMGSDGYAKLYAVNPGEPGRVYQMRKWAMAHGEAGSYNCHLRLLTTFRGNTYIGFANAVEEACQFALVGKCWLNDNPEPSTKGVQLAPGNTVNMFHDPGFNDVSGSTPDNLTAVRCTVARETTVVPAGFPHSVAIDQSTSPASDWSASHNMGNVDYQTRGRCGWVTCFVWVNFTAITNQVPKLTLKDNEATASSSVTVLDTEDQDGNWHRYAAPLFLRPIAGATGAISFLMYGHVGSSLSTPNSNIVYFADPQIVFGQRPLPASSPNFYGILKG